MKKRTGRTRALVIMMAISLALSFSVQETNADESGLVDSGIDYADGLEKEVTKLYCRCSIRQTQLPKIRNQYHEDYTYIA